MSRRNYATSVSEISTEGLLLCLELNNLTTGILDTSPWMQKRYNNSLTGMKMYDTPKGQFVGLAQTSGGRLNYRIDQQRYPYTLSFWMYRCGVFGHGWVFEFRNANNTDWCTNAGSALSYQGTSKFLFDRLCPPVDGIQNNTWYHVGITHNGIVCKFYLNGILSKSTSVQVRQEGVSFFGFRWDNGDAGNCAYGAFRKLKLYNRVLSDVEIENIYNIEIF